MGSTYVTSEEGGVLYGEVEGKGIQKAELLRRNLLRKAIAHTSHSPQLGNMLSRI